jgi:hypothetical protein
MRCAQRPDRRRRTQARTVAEQRRLGAQRRPPPDRLLKSLQDWFDATERYPRQLREVTRSEYLAMKLREFERQQTTAAAQ